MIEPNYPTEREMQQREEEGRGFKFEVDPRLFRARPSKDKEKADNKLLVLLFQFNQFEWFKKWPDLSNYYLRLFLHQVNVFGDSGTPQRRFVICEPSMNKYATERLSNSDLVVPAPFPGERTCAFCKRSNELWDKFKDAKKAAGIENLTDEWYKAAMDKHPEIKRIRDLAKEWGVQEKYYFLLFDFSRYLGEAPREKDDDGVCFIQAFIGPEALADGLWDAQKAKNRFWDFANGGGRAVVLNRDNKNGIRFCKYKVTCEGEAPQLDGETLAYLATPPAEDLHDPAEFILKLTVEEKTNYVQQYGQGSPVPRNADGDSTDSTAPSEPEQRQEAAPAPAPAAEVQTPPASRPRPRITAPSSTATAPAAAAPAPTTTAPAEKAAPAPAEPPPPPAAEAPAAPPAGASGSAPRRSRVTWRQ